MASSKKSRPKSAPSGKTSESTRPALIVRVLRTVWRPFPLLLVAASISAVMFWPEIVRHVPDLQSRPEYQLAWEQVEVTDPGRWVPQGIVSQVRQLSGLPDPLPVLHDDLVQMLANAFAQHPWVSEVVSVRATTPGRVRVHLVYREPVLMVRTQRGLYPVDAEGVLLPPSDFSITDAERLPIVEGVGSVPDGPAGTAWGDESVRGAARLAWSLTRTDEQDSAWDRFGMSSIVILEPRRPTQSLEQVVLGLTTASGSQIEWGRPPGADSLEPTVEQKLERMERYLPEYGSAGWSGKPVRLDVRQWDVVKQKELSRGLLDGARQ